jgi:hypothetical protein
VSFDAAPITCRTPLSIEIMRGGACTVTAPLYRDGVLVAATGATATLYDAGGSVVASDGSVASNVATCSATAVTTAAFDLGIGYRIEWEIEHAGGTVHHTVSAAVVRRPLYPVITDADIIRRDPLLDPSASGYRGASGASSLQDWIDEAWTEILGRIWSRGNRPALIMSPESLRAPHLYLSMAIIYRALREVEMAGEYQAMFEAVWSTLRWVYDSDDDGAPDDGGRRQGGVPMLWTC